MKNVLHIQHFRHDLRLAQVAGNAVEHEGIDVLLESVCADRVFDAGLPKLHRVLIGHELASAGIIEKCLPEWSARVQRAKHIAARAVKETRDGAENLALGPFTATWRAEDEVGFVSHCSIWGMKR